jgi:hypothetical protein
MGTKMMHCRTTCHWIGGRRFCKCRLVALGSLLANPYTPFSYATSKPAFCKLPRECSAIDDVSETTI